MLLVALAYIKPVKLKKGEKRKRKKKKEGRKRVMNKLVFLSLFRR